MKFPVVWLLGIALLVICHCSGDANASGNVKPQRMELDLTPLNKVYRKFKRANENFSLEKTVDFLNWFIVDCLLFTENNIALPENLATKIYNKLTEDDQFETAYLVNATVICQSPLFATFHNYTWVDDPDKSLNDLVYFLSRFGLPEIYTGIREFYEDKKCPEELIASIPTKPKMNSTVSDTSSNLREQILSDQTTSDAIPFPLSEIKLSCEIGEILRKLLETGLVDVVIFIDTLIHETVQKPSMHFLLGKIQEPVKGDSFHRLRLLQEFRKVNYDLDQNLKAILDMVGLIEDLKKKYGLDLRKINLVETIVSLFELVMWRKIAPVPPYVPDPEYTTTASLDY